ncbi:MAG: FHA domain-containing protein, partial [Oscillibacter sp.]|nr:FHA domain-containing protein [Oscillibacter sp.]
MSIVLSIYSQKGFREVALPERGQSELEVVIRREVFGLDKDLTLALEKRGEGWTLSPGGGTLLLNGKRQKSADIIGGMQLELDLGGRRITVISFERTNPFTAYRKYGLAGLQQIRIGWNENNDICYQDHPEEGQHYVSGSHCVLSLKNGRWELRDTSTNGTY